MTESSVPLLFWAGYATLVLVSSAYLKNWTVLVSESPARRIFPRRWLDISGVKIVNFWEAALRAVMGVIIFRPGISQVCFSLGRPTFSLTITYLLAVRPSCGGDFGRYMTGKK